MYTLRVIDDLSILYVLSYELQSVFYENIDDNGLHIGEGSIFLRDIMHESTKMSQKQAIIQSVGITLLTILILLIFFTILIVKNDNLLRKPTHQQVQMGHQHGFAFFIIDAYYKGLGQFLILLTHVLLVPALIGLAEIERCVHANSSDQTSTQINTIQNTTLSLNSSLSSNITSPDKYFICLQRDHQWALGIGIIGTFCGIMLSIFTCLFVNSQFPCPQSIPQAAWDPKGRAYLVLWKFLYIFHYDILEANYHVFFRIAAFYILYQVIQIKLEQPKLYDRVIHNLELFFYSWAIIIHFIVIIQDIGILSNKSLSKELLPLMVILTVLLYAIAYSREDKQLKEIIARDNQNLELFEEEADMELYINILISKLLRLQGEDNTKGADQYASSPQIFTIISRHMENCKNEECVCKKYEPELDRKFSLYGISSRRFDKRQSSSFNGSVNGASDNSLVRRKIPIKISYESKCQIFKAEIADCLERFLQHTEGAGIGLKLQKSYFYHAFMNSSYKALFVQLENSYTCNTFRGKIHIFHLKTRIQEEMIQSETSPISSLDITSCLKFEAKRLVFEQRILDLCLACEDFWSELINKSAQKQGLISSKNDEDEEIQFSLNDQFDDEDGEFLNENENDKNFDQKQKLIKEISDDYNVEKMNDSLLEIAATVIDVKRLFNELGMINFQSVAVLQCYVLVYRYILRDEYRFEEIVRKLGQLYRTNKLEQSRDPNPIFCDSDNYSMLLVSGDLKDLGRIIRANRGVDQLLGYSPEELKGSKINKIMPQLYSQIHENFMHAFLKRGCSNFIDQNQFIVAQNKLGFLACAVAYVKAMVDLKLGLMFVAFLKSPQKVPMTYEEKDGGCQAAQGAHFVKTKDAHFILCDGRGNISNMSQNCMRDLGLPPTIVLASGNSQISSQQIESTDISNKFSLINPIHDDQKQTFDREGIFNINQFSPNIMNPEYEFDLAKGMNYIFDSSFLKQDKALAKEFSEIKNRMCIYNISVTLRSSEYRFRSIGSGKKKQNQSYEILLFTILINSYSFTDNPNILIPVFREDDEQVAMIIMPILNSQNTQSNNNGNDELRTSKFKQFKAQVQELQWPSKVSQLRKITFAFFILLLGVFCLNYGICVSQNSTFENQIQVLNILFQYKEKIPSTSRYIRTALNIANSNEQVKDDVLQGVNSWEDRYAYYMRIIWENAEEFKNLQETVFTKYRIELGLEQGNQKIQVVQLKDLNSDYTIKTIESTISGSINLFLSKALKISKLSQNDLKNVVVPYLDFQFISNKIDKKVPITSIQQDLYFLLENGPNAILNSLEALEQWNSDEVQNQRDTFSLLSLGIAIASMFLILIIVVPLVYPLMTHYEILAELILHALNKLSHKFVETEMKDCTQLYDYINSKTASQTALKAAQRRDNEETYDMSGRKQRRRDLNKRLISRNDLNIYKNEENRGFEVVKWSLSFEEEPKTNKRNAPSIILIQNEEEKGNHGLKKYVKRGHMPPIMRRASYYEKMKDQPIEKFDSFKEDESQSNGSSVSNYSNQDFHTNLIQAIRDMGLLDQDKDDDNGLLNMFELSQAKCSAIPIEPMYMRDAKQEYKQKAIVQKRKYSILETMKKNRCKKLILVSFFVLSISVYLAINTIYTSLVFGYENNLQSSMKEINQRMLCYPKSLSVIKELVSSDQTQTSIIYSSYKSKGREIIDECYKEEQDFSSLILGQSVLTQNNKNLVSQFLSINDALGRDKFCKTLKENPYSDMGQKSQDYLNGYCGSFQNGLNNLGLHEALNYMIREEEKIVLEYEKPPRNVQKSRDLLLNSALSKQETLLDVFISYALHWQRINMFHQISEFANQLFRIFDILFGVFFAALCLATGYVGFIYLNRTLRNKIVQIYHIVLLIPYCDRTKRELNQLIKIEL